MFTKGNLNKVLKQAKQMQDKLEEVQSELEEIKVEGQAGGNMVVACVNGKQELLSIKIDPELVQEDLEMIEDMVVAAVNQGMTKASEESQKRMNAISGGMLGALGDLNIPGKK